MSPTGVHADEVYGHGPAGMGAVWPAADGVVLPVSFRQRSAPRAPRSAGLRVVPNHDLGTGALCAAEMSGEDGRLLLAAACREAALWQASATRVVVAVPAGTGLVGEVACALGQAGLSPGLLEVALSEDEVTGEGAEMPLLVSALRDLGVRVAVDRVRRGHDCLRVLRRVPVTAMRLHPALVHDLADSAEVRSLVLEAICTAHAMGAIAVALGVQTAMQRDILADLQCDEAQGPLFSGSLSVEAFRSAL